MSSLDSTVLSETACAPRNGWESAIAWSIVIPAFNERQRIAPTLDALFAFMDSRGAPYEIIVVDDGSSDGTGEYARQTHPRARVLENPGNRGKGYSVRAGMLAARGGRVLFTDADLSTPIEHLAEFEAALDSGCDMAIASRALPDSRLTIRQPWWRETSGRLFNLLVRRIAGLPFRDTQCGFKAYRRAAARRLARLQRLERWAFDVEQLILARRLDLRVRELPVEWRNSPDSRVHFLRDASTMLWEVVKVRLAKYDLSQAAGDE